MAISVHSSQNELISQLRIEFNKLKRLLEAVDDAKIVESVTKVDSIISQFDESDDDVLININSDKNASNLMSEIESKMNSEVLKSQGFNNPLFSKPV